MQNDVPTRPLSSPTLDADAAALSDEVVSLASVPSPAAARAAEARLRSCQRRRADADAPGF